MKFLAVFLVVFLIGLEYGSVDGRGRRCMDEYQRKQCSGRCRKIGYGYGICDYGECSCYGDIQQVPEEQEEITPEAPRVTEVPEVPEVTNELFLTRIAVRCNANSHAILCPYQCFRLGFSGGMCSEMFCHCTPAFTGSS